MEDVWFANNDISVDVLARLPTKTLLELKCVSREWHRLISEPCFIKQKLKTKEPVSGFFFQERFQWCDNDIKTISYIKTPENNRIGVTEIHHAVFDFLPDDVVLLAVCNGLICCRSCLPCSQPVVYICNPSNKEWVTLQWPGTDKWISLGLAFDPFKNSVDNTTNFKVVRVHQTLTDKDDSYYSMFSFDIYSSKTRMWAKLEKTCVCEHDLYKNKGICVRGGALFWLTDGDQILMFDTENEVARFVKVPVPLTVDTSIPEMCIGESEDKLHYVLISKEGILIWALEDYIEFNWTLKYFVDLDEMEQENYGFLCNVRERVASRIKLDMIPCIDPLAYKDGSLLMRVSTKIYLYNFNTRKMEELCNISSLGPNSMFAPIVLPYSMSLVPFAWP